MTEFIREDVARFMKETFKGLSKEYILNCMFNESIQAKWVPQRGDMIVGSTGNIYFISAEDKLSDKLGGTQWYYGGGMCNRDDGNVLDETYCYTMNKTGIWKGWKDGSIQEYKNYYHSSLSNYKFIPYPHETDRM